MMSSWVLNSHGFAVDETPNQVKHRNGGSKRPKTCRHVLRTVRGRKPLVPLRLTKEHRWFERNSFSLAYLYGDVWRSRTTAQHLQASKFLAVPVPSVLEHRDKGGRLTFPPSPRAGWVTPASPTRGCSGESLWLRFLMVSKYLLVKTIASVKNSLSMPKLKHAETS